jgi:uncharacterized membrane protein YbjE (DUF340 family)
MSDSRQVRLAAVIDVVAVVLFVIIGRKNHNEGSAASGVLKVAAPFLIALALGWLAARAWKSPTAVGTGVIIWLVTIVGGLVLRKLVFDGGTAVPFIIVASLFNLATLVGWRFLAEWRALRAVAKS